jgi:hypothetical protein
MTIPAAPLRTSRTPTPRPTIAQAGKELESVGAVTAAAGASGLRLVVVAAGGGGGGGGATV